MDIMLDAPNQHGMMCRISCPRGLPNELLAMERILQVGISGLEGAGEGDKVVNYNVPQGCSARGISTLNPTTLDSMFSQRKKISGLS